MLDDARAGREVSIAASKERDWRQATAKRRARRQPVDQSARYCVVGAGFSGAVVARALADAGLKVLVLDERDHVAGNCHTARDPETGVMVHVYGPHIFHTADERVWRYVNTFATMKPYAHRVKAVARGRVYSLPINLLTINQFFDKVMGPQEARDFVVQRASRIPSPATFEDQALAMIGGDLYETFFRGYTRKQWGREPRELPASVLKRLPLRFDYDDTYFAHPHQAMPEEGYTSLVANVLSSPNIEVRLGATYESTNERFAHVVYSGPIDRYFHYDRGRLEYRTLDFEVFRAPGDFQGVAVLNYCDESVPFTRITEHKYFAPWEKERFQRTICYREYSRTCGPNDVPYYPVRLADKDATLADYVARARAASGVTFLGRLGSYRYLDMDVTIREALDVADGILALVRERQAIPAFFINP